MAERVKVTPRKARRAVVARALGDPAEESGAIAPGEVAFGEFVGRFQQIFGGLAAHLQEARRVREENDRLREENLLLRESLATCVDACGRFLDPTLEGDDGDDEDHTRARLALGQASALLAQRNARLLLAEPLTTEPAAL